MQVSRSFHVVSSSILLKYWLPSITAAEQLLGLFDMLPLCFFSIVLYGLLRSLYG